MTSNDKKSALYFNTFASVYDRITQNHGFIAPQALMTLIKKQLNGKSVPAKALDVGTGSGLMAHSLKTEFPTLDIDGFDISEKMLDLAVNKGVLYSAWIASVTEKFFCRDEEYDLVTCCNVFDFLEDIKTPVQEMARTVKKGGIVAVTTRTPSLYECVNKFFQLATITGFLIPQNHTHKLQDRTVATEFEQAGLKLVDHARIVAYTEVGFLHCYNDIGLYYKI